MKIIAIDFDGTLCEHQFPHIGNEVPYAFTVLKEIQAAGHRLILWTMRSDDRDTGALLLTQAVEWCKARGITFWGVNQNPTQKSWTQSPKAYASLYIDDATLGCPLMDPPGGGRPMVDWQRVRQYLIIERIILDGDAHAVPTTNAC